MPAKKKWIAVIVEKGLDLPKFLEDLEADEAVDIIDVRFYGELALVVYKK